MKTLFRLTIIVLLILAGYYYFNRDMITLDWVKEKIMSVDTKTTVNKTINSLEAPKEQKEVVYKLALVSDSHSDTTYYPKILDEIKNENANMIIHLGDQVDTGSIESLQAAKTLLEQTGIPWVAIPGDHDHTFWPSRSLSAYNQVFGEDHFYVETDYFIAVGINNSNRESGATPETMDWLKTQLDSTATNDPRPKLIFIHIPITNNIFSRSMMDENDTTKTQAETLLQLALSRSPSEIFNGDLHSYSHFKEGQTGVMMTSVGASGSYKNPIPQYIIIDFYDDFTYQVNNYQL